MTLVGIASAGSATKALKQKFSVPGKEGWVTNEQIAHKFHNTGGDTSPLVPVVTLPAGKTVSSPGVRQDLAALEARVAKTMPGGRIAGYAATGNDAFVSKDRRTSFIVAYPPADLKESFGNNPEAAKHATAALKGATVAGAPVHVTGYDALSMQSGGGGGPGVLLEALLGGFGALLVLAFVFGSFLALVPILMAIVSIMTTFLVVWGLTAITEVSPIVQFLVALIGLGVSIDYALLVVVRWREERAHGLTGEAAIQRAMETAGRAVDVQRHDRRHRPARARRAAAAVPALGRLRRHADPADQRDRRHHAAARRALQARPANSTGRTCATTTKPAVPGRDGPT